MGREYTQHPWEQNLPHGGSPSWLQMESLRVQVPMLLEPVLMSLDGQGAYQARAALHVGKDPHHLNAALCAIAQMLAITPKSRRYRPQENRGAGTTETGFPPTRDRHK
jgi:hypothetical protein